MTNKENVRNVGKNNKPVNIIEGSQNVKNVKVVVFANIIIEGYVVKNVKVVVFANTRE
jgi:hypothetical protein